MAAAGTNIICGANFVGNNVVCEPEFVEYHTYLLQFINWFVDSTLTTLAFTAVITPGDIVNAKKQIFQLCSTGEMYPEFIQYIYVNHRNNG